MGKSVTDTARHADGWLPIFFDPEKFEDVWGDDLRAGLAERDPSLGPLQISAGGLVAIGDEYAGDGADRVLDMAGPNTALYVGGMGARDKNFYNTIARRYGYVDEATEIQDLYLSGKQGRGGRRGAARSCSPARNLVGPESYVAERIAAYKAAGVTHLSINPSAPTPSRPSRPCAPSSIDRSVRSNQPEAGRYPTDGDPRVTTMPRSHHRARAQAAASRTRAAAAHLHVSSVTTSISSPSVSPSESRIRS